jgi:hypothetical protein
MGGAWSGRWHLHTKAQTVEECLILDIGLLAREGALVPWHTGNISWSRGGKESSSIGFTVRPMEAGLCLVLNYTWKLGGAADCEVVQETIRLESTPMRFGGVRWWAWCPLAVDGRNCCRRVGKLYLPPGGRYFGCRSCYRLTYRSAQEHDKRVDFLRKHPEVLAAIANNPERAGLSNLALALKALKPM